MRSNYLKATLKAAIFAVTVLLFAAGLSAQTVDLTASRQFTTLPDGNTVPMWGWTCGTGTSAAGSLGSSLTSITLTNTTTVFTAPATVVIGAPQVAGGTQATASAALTATGTLASITITNSGSGYTAAPSITINGITVATAALGGVASCTALTYNTATGALNLQSGTTWQPPLIVVPYAATGTNLTINLTNTLPVETSLVIIGQAGGGLGGTLSGSGPGGLAGPAREAGPRMDGAHAGQTATTWTTVVPGSFTPPTQGARARSFVPEVAGVTTFGATPAMGTYTWTGLKPGTYLIRTGTYPSIQGPMGLYGVLVVTKAPVAGTPGTPGLAYPVPAGQALTGVTYDADVVALESEIDPRQNNMVAAIFPASGAPGTPTATPGFSETQVWRRSAALGPVTAINVSNGGNGYSLTSAVSITPAIGTGGSGASAAVTALTFSVASVALTSGGTGYTVNDVLQLSGGGGAGATVQVTSVNSPTTGVITGITLLNGGSGYTSAPTVVSGGTGTNAVIAATLATLGAVSTITVTNAGDGYSSLNPPTVSVSGGIAPVVATAVVTGGGCGGGAHTCYPPAVDYTPLYFLVNGLAFSKDNRAASALSIPAAASTGNVLVRYVNAGSHMHVPTVDGLNMLLVAEDGYVLPDIALALSAPQNKTLTANNPPPATCATCAVGLRIQNEVFQAAGKVFDVIVSPKQTTAGTFDSATYPTWDRSLALGTNSQRDGGMQAVLDVNDATAAKLIAANSTAVANPDIYAYAPGVTLKVSDPGKGVIANDVNVYGVQVSTLPGAGTVTLYPNGTFTYVPTGTGTDTFGYCANGTTTTGTPSYCTTVTLNVSATANSTAGNAPVANPDIFTSATASLMRVAAPGVLGNDTDPHSYPLTAVIGALSGIKVNLSADGSFTAVPTAPGTCGPPVGCTFMYQAKNSQGILSNTTTATLIFQPGSGLAVTVQDAATKVAITDYKWIIEQDLTLHIDPACQVNTGTAARPTGCPALPAGSVAPPTPATQFHTSYYPVIATGCTGPQSCGQGQTVYDAGTPCTGGLTPPACSLTAGQHVAAACDGYGICTIGATQLPASLPSDAHLTATNPDGSPASYYISILSGDAANAFNTANTKDPSVAGNCVPGTEPTGIAISSTCGHTMGGAPIPAPVAGVFAPVTVNLELAPLKTATVTAFIFEDDFPLNGEPDTGGGVDSLATLEVPLGDFQLEIWDTAGGIGDFTGQMTYDTFNVPLTNALNGTIDPATGFDACPISKTAPGVGIGVIVVCPQFESGVDAAGNPVPSPLTGQAVVKNLMQGKYSLIAHPGAAREAAGEEWLQTNSLDGGHFLDSFIRVGEPAYFQEFGPGGYHVFMGMANPKHINARLAAICAGATDPRIPFTLPCNNNINGQVTNLHQSRSPNENLYSSAVFGQGNAQNYAPLSYTNCYAAIGDSDGATIALAKCDPDGNFKFTNLPAGNYGIVIFDQWVDFIVDGSSRPVNLSGGTTQNLVFPTFTWQTHLWSRAYMDTGGLGRPVLLPDGSLDPALSPGLIQVPTRVRQRNGKIVNTLLSDIGGNSRFDETFPLFAFYTVESDTTRFRGTGVHAVNDAGGQVDGPAAGGGNGNTGPYQGILNSKESFGFTGPAANLRYPGSFYCGVADCTDAASPLTAGGPGGSTGRVDPGSVQVEGWQGGVGQFDMLDWGKTPYIAGENGGIRGHVVYSSTRPFDDPRMNFQNLWDPLVPNVTINLYKEGTAPDGTTSLTLVDTTQTSSWDKWAQGFRADGVTPNMSCTGQDPADPFFSYTMAGTTNYLYPNTPLPNNSQYKCYDGYHNLSQLQPAPYDGLYHFPSQACLTSASSTSWIAPTFTIPGNTTAYHCATVANPAAGQTGAATAILPPAKYVTEVIVPPNWELNKEEDLNLLIGDQYIAPAVAQFGGLSNIFITPDQASIDAANPSYTGPYTASNPYNQPFNCTGPGAVPGNASTCAFTPNTTNNGKQAGDYGRTSFGAFGPGGVIMQSAPCVGLLRIVPDYLSISPESGEVSPFAGYSKNLCDRKEVTLEDTMQANADFFIWTKVPKAVTFTGFISDDFSSEFDPASPAFGEKFAIPNVPVSIKDFNGAEVSRLYSDQWGTFNGLVYGSWEVDVPNITGYSPNMMITCMNDPGPIPDPLHPGQFITDPYYTPAYSTFCYENPFMPGDATYLDTPVVPTSAFAEGYNPPDCAYPDATPAISRVDGNGQFGPYVDLSKGTTLTITALGDQPVPNNAYSGPAATTAPYNLKFVTRHYGFGAQGTGSQVTLAGQQLAIVSWTDNQIVADVRPSVSANINSVSGIPVCSGPGTSPPLPWKSRCGELVITAANGKQSIDTVTVTIEDPTCLVNADNVSGSCPAPRAPVYVNGENTTNNAIQTVIDNAASGDLIIVGPGIYNEMLLMWKPVRLQGTGDGVVKVNANAHPSGKLLEPWRRQVNCLFGLALNGGFSTGNNTGGPTTPGGPNTGGGTNPYDPNYNGTAGSGFYCSPTMRKSVDPIPGEPVVGWNATLNGNIAELLQEPTLMGAYEGAGITVLAKGLENNNSANCNPEGALGCIPLNAVTATGGDCNPATVLADGSQPYATNFLCNPSRIDGITFTNASQGGGGIFAHGFNHYLQVANNRVFGNGGALTGGITIGQMETVDPTLVGTVAQALNYNNHVHVHNNSVTLNAAYGDELNSVTPASAGGVTFCTGSDNYKFDYNWVCGNLSTGDGGGLAHHGFSYNGDIQHNSFLFNQSINPTITTYGGGVVVHGAAPDGALGEAGLAFDIDVPPALSDGIGPGLVIDANLFQGNTAEEGSGGGLMLMHVNGNDVLNNPNSPANWYGVRVTNNIFVNNVAGWTGGAVALFDAVKVNFVNNTVVSNDATATAGVLFDSLGAPGANHAPPGCDPTANPNCVGFQVTTSNPQPAGLATERHSSNLLAAFASTSPNSCPGGHPQCTQFSNPMLHNNIFWQNRAFNITTNAGIVQLNPALTQIVTGGCPTTGPNGGSPYYWDIGVYNDTAPNNHSSGLTLSPDWSILTDAADYPAGNNFGSNPNVVSQFCNGSRVPPEIATQLCSGPQGNANAPGCIQPGTVGVGHTVPGGVPDSLVPPLPLFTLTPAATVDEGSNWINMFYGPLSLTNPTIQTGGAGYGVPLANSAPNTGSPAIDAVPVAVGHPPLDFFGNPRPDPSNPDAFDIGAVEVQSGASVTTALARVSPTSLAFGNQLVGRTSVAQVVTVSNDGTLPLTLNSITFSGPFNAGSATCVAPGAVAPGTFCTINVRFAPTATGAVNGTLVIATSGDPANPTLTVTLSGTGIAPVNSVSPALLTFNTPLNIPSASQPVTVTNNGSAPLTINSINFNGANPGQFGQVNNCPIGAATPLAIGVSCTINVTFAPTNATAPLPKTANLNVNVAAPATSASVALTGNLVAPTFTVLPNPLALATLHGTTSAPGFLTVTNTSPLANLTINSTTKGGTNPASFTVTSTGTCGVLPHTLAQGASCTIGVTFTAPAVTGASTATVTVNVAAPGTAQTVTLNGTSQ